MKLQKIPLSLIDREDSFRQTVEDQTLTLNVSTASLQDPLLVEKSDSGDRYILVDGYRRFFSLQQLGVNEVMCEVVDQTNRSERIISRLRKALHTKKPTGYELERMVEELLNQGYSVEDIASEIGKTTAVINKLIKTSDVPPHWKNRAEASKAGREGLSRLFNLHVVKRIKEYLMENYVEKKIKGYHVDSISLLPKIPLFHELSEKSQIRSINEAVNQTKFTSEQAKKIIFLQAINDTYSQEIHDYIYDLNSHELDQFIQRFQPGFRKNLSQEQKQHLYDQISTLSRKVGMPMNWGAFPPDILRKPHYANATLVNFNRKTL